jgi:hypothetical protein
MTAGLLVVGAVSCSDPPPATVDSVGTEIPIAELEEQARAMARGDGCKGVIGMKTVAVGTHPCGGPRTSITFCSVTTDTIALFEKLAELKAAEDKYNADAMLGTTC